MLSRNIYDDRDEWGGGLEEASAVGEIVVRDREARGLDDVEERVDQGEAGSLAKELIDKGLHVGARLNQTGEISLFVAKHKGAIGSAATIAGVTAAGVLLLRKRREK